MLKNVSRLIVAATVCGFLAGVPLASAQTADHLKCVKVKDLRGQTNIHYTLTLTPTQTPFTTEVGCQVQSAARKICYPVAKSAVTPPPFQTGAGAPVGTFVCYNMRCPKEINVTTNVTDQLGGTGPVLVKQHAGKRELCVPSGAPAPTTTSSSAVVTTTSTSSSAVVTTTSTTVSASPSFAFDSDLYFGSGLL